MGNSSLPPCVREGVATAAVPVATPLSSSPPQGGREPTERGGAYSNARRTAIFKTAAPYFLIPSPPCGGGLGRGVAASAVLVATPSPALPHKGGESRPR